jgi:endonuclease/exonuclease/phosphatase (EEP) superfamily protein YafD
LSGEEPARAEPGALRVLTWNLFHGRAVPPAGRSLFDEFARQLADWSWDVALLQEVPPWWPQPLGRAAGAQAWSALTARNFALPLRRLLATRWPDLMKSGGGGCNAILVRAPHVVTAHRSAVVRRLPERRVVHAVRLGSGTWCANLHASKQETGHTGQDIERAAQQLARWAGHSVRVFGGDLNTRRIQVPGYGHAAASRVDHVFTRGLVPAGEAEVLEHGALSDHAPVAVTLAPPSAPAQAEPA